MYGTYGKYKYDNYDIVTNLWQYRVSPSSSGMKSMVTVERVGSFPQFNIGMDFFMKITNLIGASSLYGPSCIAMFNTQRVAGQTWVPNNWRMHNPC